MTSSDSRVRQYRLYIFDSHGCRVEDCIEIKASTDDEAIARAELVAGDWPSELWFIGRRVTRFPRPAIERRQGFVAKGRS